MPAYTERLGKPAAKAGITFLICADLALRNVLCEQKRPPDRGRKLRVLGREIAADPGAAASPLQYQGNGHAACLSQQPACAVREPPLPGSV